jgi:hypothetical protein
MQPCPEYAQARTMGLQQFERRLERMVEGVFARAFRSGLQPVEIGRRLTREMDLRRTIAPRGTLAPNDFTILLSPSDRNRFVAIEEELVSELQAVARDHADAERYTLLGPVSVVIDVDPDLAAGMVLVSGEMVKGDEPVTAALVLPDGRRVSLGSKPMTIGRMPDCGLTLADPNVSRYHAEVHPLDGPTARYQIADLGSTNGTRINGIPVTAPQTLRHGDQITLGATTIRFDQG